MTNEHSSLEKYTFHTLFERVAKGLCVRGELETEQTATYWPQVPLTIAALLSHSTGLLNRGSWGPRPSAGSWFSLPQTATRTATAWFQLTRTVCGTGLYNCLTFTCFPWALQWHWIQPVHMSRLYLDVFDRMHLFLDWRLGRRSICYTIRPDKSKQEFLQPPERPDYFNEKNHAWIEIHAWLLQKLIPSPFPFRNAPGAKRWTL